ncbi:hypothetical protein BDZ91DRAFT_745400 [Kalaharituber pfeilii]|nr:hypothetical protein BDZ91DRAFT_745400 [Kalaharituber pfeilii]
MSEFSGHTPRHSHFDVDFWVDTKAQQSFRIQLLLMNYIKTMITKPSNTCSEIFNEFFCSHFKNLGRRSSILRELALHAR